jgi:hypothetical protein
MEFPDSSHFAALFADPRFYAVLFVTILAGVVRGFSGFGSALIFIPLVSAIYEPRIAAATFILIDFFCTAPFAWRLYPISNKREIWPLTLAAATTIPLGVALLIYPLDQARRLLRFYHEFTSTAPEELGSLAVLGTLPDGTKAVVILLGYNGPVDQGEQVLRPLRTFGSPLGDQVGPLPYTAMQSIVENFNPPGLRNYWKTSYLKELSDDAIDVMVERYATVPAPYTHVVLYTLGGAVSRVGKEETAVAYRDARHALLVLGMWSDPAEDEKNIRWVREFWSGMQPFSSGGFYVNYETDVALERSAGDLRLALQAPHLPAEVGPGDVLGGHKRRHRRLDRAHALGVARAAGLLFVGHDLAGEVLGEALVVQAR